MTYKFENWGLYKTDVQIHNGLIKTLYFFTKWQPKKGTPCDLPEGYTVDVNERIGLPYLKRNVDTNISRRSSQQKYNLKRQE